MSSSLLQEYLNLQIINPDDDGDYEKLGKAVEDVRKKIAANRNLIVPYSLAAFDPNISIENASIKEVSEIITGSPSKVKPSKGATLKGYLPLQFLSSAGELI
jgi:hypothetical protein